MKLFILCFLLYKALANVQPNIVVILLDDVGWNDFSYSRLSTSNTENVSTKINTPYIDFLSSMGIRFNRHYTHSTCTPTRAALLTGKYASNIGLNFAMFPGSPAGLPPNVRTLPELLNEQGYTSKMAGKWHLGHAQWKQTPVARGFDEHVGCYMWGLGSFSKRMYAAPNKPLVLDWVHAHKNGSFKHYAESRHSTEAITYEAQRMITEHANHHKNPLFIYVSFTAAHSPLQPMERHALKCAHIPHKWRRLYCGMVVGLDEGIKNITETAMKAFGGDTIIYVSSDNGGSTWFGGLNTPYRGGKTTPLEGGVRVPSFIVELGKDSKWLGERGRYFDGLVHIVDIMPTFLSLAGYPMSKFNQTDPDGIDLSHALFSGNQSPREEVLIESQQPEDFAFDEGCEAYMIKDLKLISGIIRDPSLYMESNVDRMNSTDTSWITYIGEICIRIGESIFGVEAFDNAHIIFAHTYFHGYLSSGQRHGREELVRLYNISADPSELNNIASSHPVDVSNMKSKLQLYKTRKSAPSQKYWLQYHIENEWPHTFVKGDCSMNTHILAKDCFFTHPWIDDMDDPWKDMDNLTHGVYYFNERVFQLVLSLFLGSIAAFCLLILLAWIIWTQSISFAHSYIKHKIN